jgi:hypothetical protein
VLRFRNPSALSGVMPPKVSPGQVAWLYGSNLHINNEIEIADALGHVRRFSSGASARSTARDAGAQWSICHL